MEARMRSRLAVLSLLVLVPTSLLAGGRHDGNVSTHARGDVTSCADVQFSFDGKDAIRGEDKLTVSGQSLTLQLTESRGIPVKIVGSNRSGYDVRLCKGAEDGAALSAVRLEQRGSGVTVSGPDERWSGYLLVSAPRDGIIDLASGNGPVSVSEISGQIKARVSNGPVSLKNIGGRVDAAVVNGPLSFTGRGGDVRLDAENGPVTVTLDGASWEGGELRTSAKNGPVTLKVPENYGSGVVVERGSHSPFRCAADLCGPKSSSRPGEGDRRVQIGSGATRVHLSTENGPISIKTR
jgi:hypothetical protein